MKVGEAQSGEGGGQEAGAAQREETRRGDTSALAFQAFSAVNDWFASLSDLCC